MPKQHPLERRATTLAHRLKQNIDAVSQSLQVAGGRIPFRTKLSEQDALAWWSRERYTPVGQQALAQLDPLAIAQLDTALTRHAQSQDALQQPTIQGGPPGGIT